MATEAPPSLHGLSPIAASYPGCWALLRRSRSLLPSLPFKPPPVTPPPVEWPMLPEGA